MQNVTNINRILMLALVSMFVLPASQKAIGSGVVHEPGLGGSTRSSSQARRGISGNMAGDIKSSNFIDSDEASTSTISYAQTNQGEIGLYDSKNARMLNIGELSTETEAEVIHRDYRSENPDIYSDLSVETEAEAIEKGYRTENPDIYRARPPISD